MLLARLRRRWLALGAMATLLLALAVAGEVSAAAAALAFVGVVAVLALLPERAIAFEAMRPLEPPAQSLLPGTRRFAQSLPDPCFILGRDGSVIYANDRAASTFSVSEGETLTLRLRYPELLQAFDRVVRGEGPQRIEFMERVPTERWFSAWFAPLDESPLPDAVILILDDLSAARAMERMRVDFVANASHELRTPLASLAGFIETLQGPARDDPAARARFLAIMHEQATRMSRLIDDLLSLSRIEMKAHMRPRDPTDLVAVLRHVIDTMTPMAGDLGLAIEADLPSTRVVIAGDRDELVQVFGNLVENACKYGQSGKRVVVRLEAPASRGPARVAVTDFGPGIAPEHLPRLTERFYRIDGDDSRRHRGTGLGLAIVKHIATRHRARLTIESQPGRGATFAVTFPEAETLPAGPATLAAVRPSVTAPSGS